MTGEAAFAGFCLAWLVVGGVLLVIQLHARLRSIDQLRQLRSDETASLTSIEAGISLMEDQAQDMEMQARTLRRQVHIWEQRLEIAGALDLAAVAVPLAAKLKLPRRPGFE